MLITTAVAWFCSEHVIEPEFSGSAITGYLDGDGTKAVPYKLRNATDVYNFAWLQYMGYFNKEGDDGKITQYYFELMNDIDMGGIIIPPIGTTVFPFVGHFKGNGYCISDVTVSNYLDGDEAQFGIVKRPLSVTNIEGTEVSITGFFGVVGALDDEMAAKLIDDSQVSVIGEKVNAVHDLFLDNITIRTETDESLIGLLAGYVNCSISNVGLGQCALHIGNKTLPLSALEMQQSISMFSLIGNHHEDNVFWGDKPTGDSGTTGGDGDLGWGGSIDMMELNKRITYIFGSTAANYGSNTGYVYNLTNVFGFTGSMASKKSPYSNRNQAVYLMQGTMLPLSVDETMFQNQTTGQNNCETTPYYQSSSEELVRSNNTGYIVGGGTSYSAAFIRVRADVATGYSTNYPGIYKSLGTAINSSGTFSGDNFQMLTIDVNGNTYVISDEYNKGKTTALSSSHTSKTYTELGLQKYYVYDSETKSDMGVRTSLVNTLQGSSLIHALHFMKKIDISNTATTTASVNIMNQVKNCEMVNGAINFTVKSRGFITAVAGTYYQANADHSLFTIFSIDRADDGTINSIEKISTIKEKCDSKGNLIEYVYNLPDANEEAGYQYNLVYDIDKMNVLDVEGAAYYFEIPLNAGDYAVGCDTEEAHNGAYLMYLDIGANGNESAGGGSDSTETGATHTITGITFVDDDAINNRSTDGYSVISFSLDLNEMATTPHSGLEISFNRLSKTQMTYTVTVDQQSSFDIKYVKDDEELEVQEDTG